MLMQTRSFSFAATSLLPRLTMARIRKARPDTKAAGENHNVDISEEEQWRIINDTGILKQVPRDMKPSRPEPSGEAAEEEGLSPFVEEMFNTTMLIIPMSFMLLMMEMCVAEASSCRYANGFIPRHSLVHYQYGRKPEMRELLDRMLPGVPSEYWVR